ncbi:hypothetical protein JKF63_02982 [Porcisia hertigi]|uniref:Anaphase-promoting complex subunit 1 n=1 Tax=Porcisia hertigi TaxID=2761500 RepID=A0A836L8A5_9TRYP|nr:hypothetical protein JKF63_02982 [Porcisia hertigi]
MSLSPYTIEVGPCQADGRRDVFLYFQRRLCFSTTHRGITRVCLVKWPARSCVRHTSDTNDIDETEALRTQRTEQVYQTLLEYGNPHGPTRLPQWRCSGHDAGTIDNNARSPLEEYLCVFHREELADQHGRYTFVQPHTICSAYRIADSTSLELVLHNVTPTDISAAATGVFVRGSRQSNKALPPSTPIEYQSVQYKPASNLWWMGAPLSLKPVYVAVSLGPQVNAAGSAPMDDGGKASGPPAEGIAAARSKHSEKASGETLTRLVSSPISVGGHDAPAQRHGGDNGCSSRHSDPEGRTAQGQFEFSPSPPSSPNISWPGPSATRPPEGQGPQAAAAASPPPAPSASPPLVSNAPTRYIPVEATVLVQLEIFDSPTSRAACASLLTVVRTGDCELGLATTTPQYPLDCMLWQWWPHRVRLPPLTSGNAALSAVASPHASLDRYVIFLYDSHQGNVFVLRTPHLRSGAGDFELLFSFPYGSLPFVLPCLRAPHPAPIAVCNYPRPNCISVYDVVALLASPAATTVAMELDLEMYQAHHPAFFGKLCTSSKANGSVFHGERAVLSTNGTSLNGAVAALSHPTDGVQNAKERSFIAASWRADAINGVSHSVQSILYHYQNCLVVQYNWPGGSAQPPRMEGVGITSGGSASPLCSYSSGGEGVQGSRSLYRRRRRCESTVSYTVEFPAITLDKDPLLVFVLEALSAAAGPRAVAALEYALLTELWRCKCGAAVAVDAFDLCAGLLQRIYRGWSSDSDPALASTGARQPLQLTEQDAEVAPHVFVDPSTVTIQQVRRAVARSRTTHALPYCQNERQVGVSSATHSTASVHQGAIGACAWTRQERALALVALHLLFEACRAQENLWSLLPRLAIVNRGLSEALRWPSYVEYYDTVIPSSFPALSSPSLGPPTHEFTALLPEQLLRQRFDSVGRVSNSPAPRTGGGLSVAAVAAEFVCGDAPALFSTLSFTAVRCTVPAGIAGPYGTWPLLTCLPDTHPISVANHLVALYGDIYSVSTGSLFPTQGGTSAGNCRGSDVAAPHSEAAWWRRICELVLRQRISPRVIPQVLNATAAYPLLEALAMGRERAESTLPSTLVELVGRLDRCPPTSRTAQILSAGQHILETAEANAVAHQFRVALSDDDGVSVRPDFRRTWKDSRLDMVQNLFNTVAPISLSGFEDRPEELTGALELLSCRAQAMPLGRGMLTMCTQSFKVQDSIPIAPLNLNGYTNDGISVASKVSDDLMWPLFHNGCAAGLRFLPLPPVFFTASGEAPRASQDILGDAQTRGAATFPPGNVSQSITKQWVMYQTKNIGNPASRAGLLLATGILGHLTVLQRTDIFYLLISRHEQYVWREATTMAVMLGLSCSFCGTGNEAVFRCLSVHVQSLNPSAEDIEVSLDVQTAALASMGLLCQRMPSNSFLVEVLLTELSRMPTDEHCTKREGYVLGAAFGLGQLLLGAGQSQGVQHIENRLLAIMRGAPRSATVSTRDGVDHFEEAMGSGEAGFFFARALLTQGKREATYNTCASVYEGDYYNVFVSGPAATVALGMMYLKTDNAFIASKITPPDRRAAMQKLTPLMCHLRSMMTSLIAWSAIEPTRTWLYNQLPSSLLELTKVPLPPLATQQMNFLLMNLAHCIAGHVMAVGLRFAGTMDSAARDLIFAELQGFLAAQIGSTKVAIPAVQRATGAYETCLLTCANALSLVMAGTGDLEALALLLQLHRRTNVSYGSHLAISMSIGLLFLGSGRLTLCNDITAVAALLMAFYPVWPKDAEDNTCHLQALRHLYGLAVVPRVMEAVDAVSHQPVSVPVRIVLRKGSDPEMNGGGGLQTSSSSAALPATAERVDDAKRVLHCVTPCLYPPVDMIERVEVRSSKYYPLVFYSTSRELTQSASMLFRVMAKESGTALVHGRGGLHALGTRTPIESTLLSWLHRLFRQSSTTITEGLTIIDNLKLVLRVQRLLLSRTTGGGAMLLSADFGEAMMETMERRYSFIFLHGSPSDVEHASSGPRHPLHQLIVERKSRTDVIQSIAHHPHGTVAFPCDFTALAACCVSPDIQLGGTELRRTVSAEEDMHTAIDLGALTRWVIEALHYYGIGQREVELLRQAFMSLSTPLGDGPMGSSRGVSSSVQRLTTLLRLQAATLLPLSTLEKIWGCCFEWKAS